MAVAAAVGVAVAVGVGVGVAPACAAGVAVADAPGAEVALGVAVAPGAALAPGVAVASGSVRPEVRLRSWSERAGAPALESPGVSSRRLSFFSSRAVGAPPSSRSRAGVRLGRPLVIAATECRPPWIVPRSPGWIGR